MLGYVFPIIFTEDQMPGGILTECQKGNAARNEVVHNQRREFKEHVLHSWLTAIRKMCDILRTFCEQEEATIERIEDGAAFMA
jgi:hypothetical protein